MTRDKLEKMRLQFSGLSPEKSIFETHQRGWREAASLGFAMTPWTFRASTVKGYRTVTDEMEHFIKVAVSDGVITDNPDLVPRP